MASSSPTTSARTLDISRRRRASSGELVGELLERSVVRAREPTPDGGHPSCEGQKRNEVPRLRGRWCPALNPGCGLVHPGKGDRSILLDEPVDGAGEQGESQPVVHQFDRLAEPHDENAAHTRAGVGRDQL